ncbi:uncharacterized protein LOC135089244 [Scylla paramamosain]
MGVWWLRGLVAVVVVVAVAVPGWGREGPVLSSSVSSLSSSPSSAYLPGEECKHIKFSQPGQATVVRQSVLRQMCLRAAPHVDVNKIFKQFAIFLLHRDDFDDSPKWHSGDAKAVLDDPYWAVNEVTVLKSTKYQWYVHGLPMWPLPHQALANKTTSKRPSLKKKKPVDWPNYGLATPIYFASKAWRDQAWSVEEFFQQEKKKSPFKSHEDFHKLVLEVVGGVNGSKVESYSEWAFLKFSLPLMVRSMTRRNKGLCPDEMYIYFRLTPCYPKEPQYAVCAQAARHARLLLTVSSCPTTTVIVGFSKEYSEEENLLPL